MSAVRRAIAMGVDLVEVDVQCTKDGALVLMHDATLLRTTDVRRWFPRRRPWRVEDFTYDEILSLDAGSWISYVHAGEGVPTLRDVLAEMHGSRTGLLVEVKRPNQHRHIVRALFEELTATAVLLTGTGPLIVQSFDVAAMKELKTLAPHVPVGILGDPPPRNIPALASWAEYVNPPHYAATPQYLRRLHDAGLESFVWTVDDRRVMERIVQAGADGVITNRPDVFATASSMRRGP